MLKSDSIAALAAALAKAQGAMGAAKKDAANPFFKSKYADLAAIVEAIKAPLSENGLAYAQGAEMDPQSGAMELETILMHSSGEWISSVVRMMPVKPDPQGVGSCMTYARRYGLQAMAGIPADDDDGNEASGNKAAPTKAAPLDGIAMASESGRNQAAEMKAQRSESPAPPAKPQNGGVEHSPDPAGWMLPDDPSDMVLQFRGLVNRQAPLTWPETAIKANAQTLAIGLKKNGLGDTSRSQVYEILTGKAHGAEMDPRELVVMQHNNSGAGVQKMLKLLAWAQENAKEATA